MITRAEAFLNVNYTLNYLGAEKTSYGKSIQKKENLNKLFFNM